MTKTVTVTDHDPLRTGTPRREAKVWGKAGSAAKSLGSPGCHHRDRHRATALEHLCDPKWERRRGAEPQGRLPPDHRLLSLRQVQTPTRTGDIAGRRTRRPGHRRRRLRPPSADPRRTPELPAWGAGGGLYDVLRQAPR